MTQFSRKCSIAFFLTVWFFVWGVCPWGDAPVAQGAEAADAEHRHHGGADETHHASKGTEHSCTGSISYSMKLQSDRPLDHSIPIQDLMSSADPVISLHRPHGLLRPLCERHALPKLLTEYYQLYSVYRI